MKKIIVFIVCFFSILNVSNAFVWGLTELDLYSNIEIGLDELEDKLLEFELNGGQQKKGILKEINIMARHNDINECFDESKEIEVEKFKQIVEEENVSEIANYFSKDCYNENEGYLVERATVYLAFFKEYLRINNITAKDKTKTIYQVSSLGMYSDGILENSGFDLISDIEDIDKIIFSQVTEYKGGKPGDLEKLLEDELYDAVADGIENLNDKINEELDHGEDAPEEENDNYVHSSVTTTNNDFNITDSTSTYTCLDDTQNSGLSNESIDYLINNIENPVVTNRVPDNFQNENGGNEDNNSDSEEEEKNYLEELESEYVKVVDNSEWPCTDFFCILVEFISNDNSSSTEKVTIEFLLKRSNEHLAKFAGTSLIPAKFSTNQFQLGLQDLNFSDIFHLGIQITKKPIPILNIEKEGKIDNSEYSGKNLIEEYYIQNGLNYKRRNSIVLLDGLEQNKQNINNSVGLTTERILHKDFEYKNIKSVKNNSETLTKIIGEKVALGSLKNFEEQFIEVDKFTSTMNDYIENLKSIIIEMNKIPIDKS